MKGGRVAAGIARCGTGGRGWGEGGAGKGGGGGAWRAPSGSGRLGLENVICAPLPHIPAAPRPLRPAGRASTFLGGRPACQFEVSGRIQASQPRIAHAQMHEQTNRERERERERERQRESDGKHLNRVSDPCIYSLRAARWREPWLR